MIKLPQTAPDIYEKFLKGGFVIKRSQRCFSAVGVDMALEQTINRSKKSSSGIIGNTKKKMFAAQWDILYHELLAISNVYRDISGVNTSNSELSLHHEFNNSETQKNEDSVRAMVAYVASYANPFMMQDTEGGKTLHNILTRESVPSEVAVKLLQFQNIGAELYTSFRDKRFINKSSTIWDVIHRQNLPTFQQRNIRTSTAIGKKRTTKDGNE